MARLSRSTLPDDTKARLQHLIRSGADNRAIMSETGCASGTVHKYRRMLRREGRVVETRTILPRLVEPRGAEPFRAPTQTHVVKLMPWMIEELIHILAQKTETPFPDEVAWHFAERYNTHAPVEVLGHVIQRLAPPPALALGDRWRAVVTVVAGDEGGAAAARAAHRSRISALDPHALVFCDESGCPARPGRDGDDDPTYRRGFTPSGYGPDPDDPADPRGGAQRRRRRWRVLAALAVDGLVDARVYRGSLTRAEFVAWLRAGVVGRMVPHPGRRSVLVLDGGDPWHRAVEVEYMCAARGVRVVYLPPGSADLNPVEAFLADLRRRLRHGEAPWWVAAPGASSPSSPSCAATNEVSFGTFLRGCVNLLGFDADRVGAYFAAAGVRSAPLSRSSPGGERSAGLPGRAWGLGAPGGTWAAPLEIPDVTGAPLPAPPTGWVGPQHRLPDVPQMRRRDGEDQEQQQQQRRQRQEVNLPRVAEILEKEKANVTLPGVAEILRMVGHDGCDAGRGIGSYASLRMNEGSWPR